MNKLTVYVINLNNLQFTLKCIEDLNNQDTDNFNLVVVDQNSKEVDTKIKLKEIVGDSETRKCIFNKVNIPLNHLWNDLITNCDTEYVCLLNNDVRLTENFISDTLMVLEKEQGVGIVCHSTNHPKYNKKSKLDYVNVGKHKYRQGWDFTFRCKLFKTIPESIKTYCGDDFIFETIYNQGYELAYVLSSPMIHYQGMSSKYSPTTCGEDELKYRKEGYKLGYVVDRRYSHLKPKFFKFG